MKTAVEIVKQYLSAALEAELASARALGSHLEAAPTGGYRSALERHLGEKHRQAERLERRLRELGGGPSLLARGRGAVGALVSQAVGLARTPIELRGTVVNGPDEGRLLEHLVAEIMVEAREVALYGALERMAERLADTRTAELAGTLRVEEERQLERLRALAPELGEAIARAEVEGVPALALGSDARAPRPLGVAPRPVRRTAPTTAAAPGRPRSPAATLVGDAGSERPAGSAVGATGPEHPPLIEVTALAIPRYDTLTGEQIVGRLPRLSQLELAAVEAHERRGRRRTAVLERLRSLRGEEPWPGYDERSVAELKRALVDAEDAAVLRAGRYERTHKGRQSVVQAIERRLAAGAAAGAASPSPAAS